MSLFDKKKNRWVLNGGFRWLFVLGTQVREEEERKRVVEENVVL
jgi:hypothetical protein